MSVHGILTGLSATFWLGALLQPWLSWLNREVLEREAPVQPARHDLSDVTVVIPARNEAAIIDRTLAALAGQGDGLRVILVDDRSDDGTADVARRVPALNLTIVSGEPLPGGWAGKLWALDQGVSWVADLAYPAARRRHLPGPRCDWLFEAHGY